MYAAARYDDNIGPLSYVKIIIYQVVYISSGNAAGINTFSPLVPAFM